MIVKMNKLTVIILDSERRQALEELGSLGVMHLEEIQGEGETYQQLLEQQEEIENVLLAVPDPEEKPKKKKKDEPAATASSAPKDTESLVTYITELIEERKKINETIDKNRRALEYARHWGDFDEENFKELRDSGVSFTFFRAPRDTMERLKEKGFILPVQEDRKQIRGVIVTSSSESIDLSEEEDVQLLDQPERSAATIRNEIDSGVHRIAEIEDELMALSDRKKELEHYRNNIQSHADFERVHSGMPSNRPVAYLSGYIPAENTEDLREAARKNSWGLIIDEPDQDDPVPTLIRNPKWINIIKPVFRLLGTVPGYREHDISFWFLAFFTVFFAMLIGDAGYGLVFLVLTVFMRIKLGRPSQAASLMMLMSLATMAWGVVTGTWFGSQELSQIPILKQLIVPEMYSFNPESDDFIKEICFIIGTVHLSIAHIKNLFTKLPSLRGWADLGWLTMIWGLYFLVLNVVMQEPFNQMGAYLIAAGLLLVVVFGEQKGRFFKGLFKGIINLPINLLDSISAFSDIISYIRLYAVGLATLEIAKSFNSMAADAGIGGSITGAVIAGFVLLFGHVLNMGMGGLSIIVHGVRLNMLEFSGHLGMEWTGIPYKPFRWKKS